MSTNAHLVMAAFLGGVFGAVFVAFLTGDSLKHWSKLHHWLSPLARAERARERELARKATALVKQGVPMQEAYWKVDQDARKEVSQRMGWERWS